MLSVECRVSSAQSGVQSVKYQVQSVKRKDAERADAANVIMRMLLLTVSSWGLRVRPNCERDKIKQGRKKGKKKSNTAAAPCKPPTSKTQTCNSAYT